MKILVLMLLISTPNIAVRHKWKHIEFPVKLLQHDLEAIESFFEKFEKRLSACLYWPQGILFEVYCHHDYENDELITRIRGPFKLFTDGRLPEWTTYSYLNFKKGELYVTKESGSRTFITMDTTIRYAQPDIEMPDKRLSIKYFGLEEIMKLIRPFYDQHKKHMDTALEESPAAFLAIALKCYEHIIEYTLFSKSCKTPKADGKLRVLIGAEEGPETLVLSESIEANRLVFNQRDQTLIIPHGKNIDSMPLENVFGVRMARTGFLVQSHDWYRVKRFSSEDLAVDAPKNILHQISVRQFLDKIKHVEPKFKYEGEVDYELRPNSVYFQLLGHILMKKVNTSDRDVEECPLIIEYKTKGSHFLYEKLKVEAFCTNDSELWVKGDGASKVPLTDEVITLTYPKIDPKEKRRRPIDWYWETD